MKDGLDLSKKSAGDLEKTEIENTDTDTSLTSNELPDNTDSAPKLNWEADSEERTDSFTYYNAYGPSGLGGWLVLVQIQLYFTLFGLVVFFFDARSYYVPETINVLSAYNANSMNLINYQVTSNVLMFILTIAVLVLMYLKKKLTVHTMILMLVLNLVLLIVNYVLTLNWGLQDLQDPSSILRQAFRSLIGCAIWIPYFLKSVRVENTFVR